jgi:predicted O-methyltransferase YrrM
MPTSEWTSEHDFTVDGVAYRSMVGPVRADQMLVLKPREAVEAYEELLGSLAPRRMLELGIYNGGSAALLAQLATPTKFVVLDLRSGCPPLERFLDAHGLRGTVVPHYGVDQANPQQLDEVMAAEFDDPVDLIIDDASHLEPQTRASFNRLFPHLRPGGLYIIEDWAWAHSAVGPKPTSYHGVTPLSALVCELIIVAGRHPKQIASVTVNEFATIVRRGPLALRPDRFDVTAQLGVVGREMVDRLRGVSSRTPDDPQHPATDATLGVEDR